MASEPKMFKYEWKEFRDTWLDTACFAKGYRMVPEGCHDNGHPGNEVCEACVSRRRR